MTNKRAPHPPLEVREHQLYLIADPFRLKVISEAISEYATKHNLEDDTTLNDFRYNMEAVYQNFYNLDEDDWDFIPDHKEKIHGAF